MVQYWQARCDRNVVTHYDGASASSTSRSGAHAFDHNCRPFSLFKRRHSLAKCPLLPEANSQNLMQRGVISSLLSCSETQLLTTRRTSNRYRTSFVQRQMPKARRFAMHARTNTDDDLLPRLSQQERLFSNLDGSMKHETGSLYGSVTLIAGARR